MAFVVETVSLNSFYASLLLGLPKLLTKCRNLRLKSKHLSKNPPVPYVDLCGWEEKYGLLLPEDMRRFFSSIDGLCFKWTCSYGTNKSTITGGIDINGLYKMCPLLGLRTKSEPGVALQGRRYKLKLGPNSKVFLLSTLPGGHMVTLVYLKARFLPTVWLCTSDLNFYFLADNFTTYLRMAVAHLGFPNWQLLYTPEGVPEWSKILMRLVTPKLLLHNKKAKCVELIKKERLRRKMERVKSNATINTLDENVFNPNRVQMSSMRRQERNSPMLKALPKKKYCGVKSRYMDFYYNSHSMSLSSNPTIKPRNVK